MVIKELGPNLTPEWRNDLNNNFKEIAGMQGSVNDAATKAAAAEQMANEALEEVGKPVGTSKLEANGVTDPKLAVEVTNKLYRGVYQVTPTITKAVYNAADKSYTISFATLRVFKAAGYTIQSVNGMTDVIIPDKQALVVDLNGTSPLTAYVTTGNGYVSGNTHGINAFANDTKLILFANYSGSIHGPLANAVQIKLNQAPITPSILGDGAIVKKTTDAIDIYVKGGNKSSNRYIHYPIRHFVKELDRNVAASNYDIWRIEECYEVEKTGDFTFTPVKQIVYKGEWELAIRESGATDAIGGSFHGDEVMKEVTLLINGMKRDITTTETIVCDKVSLMFRSDLYRDNIKTPDNLVKVGEHFKLCEFTKDGMELYQEVKFDVAMNLTYAYLTMLPILRLEGVTTGQQITNEAFRDYDYKIYDVSQAGFTHDLLTKRSGIKQAWIYGTVSGISANVKIIERNVWLPNENMRIDNPSAYNKFYFDFCGTYTTTIGEVWKQRSKFKIDTSN